MQPSPNQHQRIYDEYWRLVDLWRFYLKLMVEATTLFAAIAGGILSYVLKGDPDQIDARAALYLPAGLGFGFAIISSLGFFQSIELRRSIRQLGRDAGVTQIVHASLLPVIVFLAFVFYSITAVSCLVLAWS